MTEDGLRIVERMNVAQTFRFDNTDSGKMIAENG